MRDQEGEIWGIILAAGDGQRLAAVTVDACGRVVPKQYCALVGTDTLLEQTVARLAPLGRRILLHSAVPANDGGLALGQAAIAAALTLRKDLPTCA